MHPDVPEWIQLCQFPGVFPWPRCCVCGPHGPLCTCYMPARIRENVWEVPGMCLTLLLLCIVVVFTVIGPENKESEWGEVTCVIFPQEGYSSHSIALSTIREVLCGSGCLECCGEKNSEASQQRKRVMSVGMQIWIAWQRQCQVKTILLWAR